MSKEQAGEVSEIEEVSTSSELQKLRYLIAQWFPATHADGTRLKTPKSEIKKIRKMAKSIVPELFGEG